jgi:hypothetical protein
MMNDMNMSGMGWMMWAGTAIWVLVFVVLILGAAALVKYLAAGDRGDG